MCFDPVSLAIAVGTTALGAATSASAASSRNRSIERSARSQNEATATLNAQESAQAQQAKLERSRESQRLRALSVVQAAGRGVDISSGSVQLWQQQAIIDEATNRSTIDSNLRNNTNRNTSAYNANAEQLKSQARNVLLDTFTGGLQGLSTGLSIGQGVNNILGPGDVVGGSVVYPEDYGPQPPTGWRR